MEALSSVTHFKAKPKDIAHPPFNSYRTINYINLPHAKKLPASPSHGYAILPGGAPGPDHRQSNGQRLHEKQDSEKQPQVCHIPAAGLRHFAAQLPGAVPAARRWRRPDRLGAVRGGAPDNR